MGTSNHPRSIIRLPARAFALGLSLAALSMPAAAYDLTERLSIGGVLSGAYQCQNVSSAPGTPDTCRGALPFQPEISFRPNERNEFFASFGFAEGNGLTPVSPFVLAPWAADLQDDVKNINGRNRDHLLTAGYKHSKKLRGDQTLSITAGLIDATNYLDENKYSNDEYTQFMNEALVNAPSFFAPSYDWGGALEWDAGRWSVHGVVMNVGENDAGNSFNYFGTQIGYTVDTALGEGNYRIIIAGTSKDFPDPSGANQKRIAQLLLSFDQQLGETFGAFLRIGWQDDDPAVVYDAIYSGGMDIRGRAWGRPNDNIGLSVGYLSGGSLDVGGTYVAETYYRFQVKDHFAVTVDAQYLRDKIRAGAASPHGYVFGVRSAVEF